MKDGLIPNGIVVNDSTTVQQIAMVKVKLSTVEELKKLAQEIEDVLSYRNDDETIEFEGKTIGYDYAVWKQCSDKIDFNYARIKQLIKEL